MRELETAYNQIELEKKIQKWWRTNNIQKTVQETRQGKPIFGFLEGPPTINGFMHIGHTRGRTMKDAILRYKTMKGFDVWRRAGWDCQGLPVEIEVEKKLGLTSKRDIEKVGFEKFVEECNRSVDYYLAHWKKNSEKLGLWLDYEHAYETRKDDYIEFVWWAVKKFFDEGILKEDFKVVPTCPRCETPLSGHEVAQGYTLVTDPSIYVKFQLEGKNKEHILIWTTTPWTIPGDEAVSVNPKFQYSKVKVGEETWIMAEELVEKVMENLKISDYQIIETFKGENLKGLKYTHPLIRETPEHQNHQKHFDHSIICGDHVTIEEGTGCVHTAPAHGLEDYEVGKSFGITTFCPVDQRGIFTDEAGKYAGKFVKAADAEITEDLRKNNLLVWSGKIEHEYPLCWRCDSPLIYRLDKQWFIRIDPVRDKMVDENNHIAWVPEWAGKRRFGEWLVNSEDWCISRSRVWGTPLPVWKCEACQEVIVLSGKEELKKFAIAIPERLELHRPWVDKVVIECKKCGKEMRRVQYVLDCWLDSGLAHAASVDYLKDPRLFKNLYPYDFVTEAIDQTRGWFYSLLTTGVLLFDKGPYKRALCQGHVVDKYGQKMSKSKGNVIWLEDALRDNGVDVIRAYLLWKVAPEDTLAFDYDELGQIKRTLGILWNIFTFANTYMTLDSFKPEELTPEKVEKLLKKEDRWLLSRSQSTIKAVTENLDNLRLHVAIRNLLNFIVDDISRFYIRLIRRRTWIEVNELEKMAAYSTLYNVLVTTVKLMSPFTPHLTEELYHSITGKESESIHSCDWPIFDEKLFDGELEEEMDICKESIKAALAARQRGRIKLRWPVKMAIIVPSSKKVENALTRQKEVLINQVNTKTLTIQKTAARPSFIEVVVEPNYSVIGAKFKSKIPEITAKLRSTASNAIVDQLSSYGEIRLKMKDNETVILTKDDITLKEKLPSHIVSEDFMYGTVFVDVTRTAELLTEALVKEVVRRAQIMRKEMQLEIEQFVNLSIKFEEEETKKQVDKMRNYVMSEVRVKDLKLLSPRDKIPSLGEVYVKDWEIENEKVTMSMQRLT
ncbi:MAG: isoleucine--tRNA ligase [Candidatus Bathyarchaeota archaeon]